MNDYHIKLTITATNGDHPIFDEQFSTNFRFVLTLLAHVDPHNLLPLVRFDNTLRPKEPKT